MIGCLTAVSFAPLAWLYLFGDGIPTAVDGIAVIDQAQYLAWVKDAQGNGLISNLFDVVPDKAVFVHPQFSLSGLLTSMGLSVEASYLLWKPISVAAMAAGVTVYIRRTVPPGGWRRCAALVLALFFFAPVAPLSDWTSLGGEEFFAGAEIMGYEMWIGAVWTYQTAVSVALMPIYLLALERLVEPDGRAPGRGAQWYAVWAALAGLLSSWLHPWQGATLVVITGAAWAWSGFSRRWFPAGIAVLGAVLPLCYYFALSRVNDSWERGGAPNELPHLEWWVLLSVAPLAAFALAGLRRRPNTRDRLLLLWTPAAVAVFLALDGSYIYHAFSGITIPLAVLATRGWARLGLPPFAAVTALALATIPGAVMVADDFRESVTRGERPHQLRSDEREAIQYVARGRRAGPVVAPVYLGQVVPGQTGRRTWVGHPSWTPDYERRLETAEALFTGRLPPAHVRSLVRSMGVAFLIADCGHPHPLGRDLGPLLLSERRFGCATVYAVRG